MTTKKTTYSLKDGRYTGKTVTASNSDGSKTITNYRAGGSGLSREILGPSWTHSSTTKVDSKGNSRTTSAKKSWW